MVEEGKGELHMKMVRENVEREVSTEAARKRLEAMGYKLADAKMAEQLREKTSGQTAGLPGLTEAQLRAMAKKKGIKDANAKSGEELLEALKEVESV